MSLGLQLRILQACIAIACSSVWPFYFVELQWDDLTSCMNMAYMAEGLQQSTPGRLGIWLLILQACVRCQQHGADLGPINELPSRCCKMAGPTLDFPHYRGCMFPERSAAMSYGSERSTGRIERSISIVFAVQMKQSRRLSAQDIL